MDVEEQCIIVEATKQNGAMYVVNAVYVSTYVIQRRDLWNKLVGLSCNISTPWMVLGDFDFILNLQV